MSGRVWIRVSVVLGALVLLLWAILFAPWERSRPGPLVVLH